ncbi:hypothetical protein LPB86_15140 [Pedobacter sp. MC2016-14]|uniref:hypothetical protein n=1 Tax=Pedobacter sp. MC2016-14 TaxID=2897327 RepID=UPI001E65D88F|nr:hypothetical protein [Pedobacter sp. MC2016-14]MCD0489575.1 hypothetical protein [Pedobacter sp. MC2016-14]
MLKVRMFRAIDDLASCTKFAQGHAKVLLDYGVTKVTSSSTDWFYNPAVYVIVAEMADTNETVGGIRIHIADGITRLPMEDAVAMVDKSVYGLIDKYTAAGTAELCGLWNAKTTAGWGIGSYILMRAGISIIPKLNLSTLFALCAPHTLNISVEKGFEVEKSIGNEGTFIYPKLDLVATSIIIKNTDTLPLALPSEKTLIFDLRENPLITRIEASQKRELEISYHLLK